MITQKKIAEALGLSASTVANIINGTPNYKKETKERVLRAVEEFGYQPNRASRAIKRGRSNLIGVIHSGSAFEIGQKAVHSLLQEISRSDYNYLVVDLQWHAGDSRRVISEMVQARVEGVILCADVTTVFSANSLDILQRAEIPVISLYGDSKLDVPVVGDSAALSFYSLTRHLQQVGHNSILLFSCPRLSVDFRSTNSRIRGFEAALRGWGDYLAFDEDTFVGDWPDVSREYQGRRMGILVYMNWDKVAGDVTRASYSLTQRILTSLAVPNAVMATNDRAAYGVFSAAYEAGIRVPEEMAITGADDDDLSSLSLFRLTTIRQDVTRSCRAAVKMLLTCIRTGGGGAVEDCSFPSKLVLRQSCGRIVANSEELVACVPTESCLEGEIA